MLGTSRPRWTRPGWTGSRAGAVAVVLALAVALFGCLALPGSNPDRAGSPAVGPATGDTNPALRGQLKDGGELRIAMTGRPAEWNPWHRDATWSTAVEALDPVLPHYWTSDEHGVLSRDPHYLAGEEVVSTDPLVVRLRLNPAAVWADGHPMTWEDIAAPLTACRTDLTADGPALGLARAATVLPCADTVGPRRIAGVERGGDEHEAVISFTGAYPQWRDLVSAPGRAELFADPTGFSWTHPDVRAQAGPFVVEQWDPATGVLSERRNARWWGEPAVLDRLTFRWVPTALQARAFVNNEVDVVATGLGTSAAAKVLGVADGAIRTCPGQAQRTLVFRQDGLLASADLRRAVALAVDRDTLASLDVGGTGSDSSPIHNRFLAPSEPGHRDNSAALGPLGDTDAARRLLAADGWSDDPVRRRGGTELRLEYLWSTDDPVGAQDARALQAQLGAVGIGLVPVEVGAAEFAARVRAGDFELAALNLPAGVRPELWFRSDSAVNLTGVGDAQLDAWLDQLGAGPRLEAETANRVDEWLWAEAVTLPLYVVPDAVGTRASVANYGASGRASVRWDVVGFLR